MDPDGPVVAAGLRIAAAVVAALVVVVGFFDGTVGRALAIGLVFGIGVAAVGAVRDGHVG